MINKISNWKKREGSIKESVWLSEGIRIFRELLEIEPNNKEYKANLAMLLTRSGTDEKLKYINLLKAKDLFEEVLELFPDNAEAIYRLGHISYENHEYETCIDYFTKAIGHSLSDIRLFRAYTTISKANFHVGEDEKSKIYLQKAIEMDKGKNFTSEINEVKTLITQDGHYRKIVRYSDGITQFLSTEDAENLWTDADSDKEAILDLSHLRPSFTGPEDVVRIERKEAEILSYLIDRKNRYVGKEELLTLWEEGEAPELDTIKTYISKIRNKLGNCLPEEMKQTITTKIGHGYRWTCPIPTKIIKQL
ncbi:winged helix-turn-helix domain-containing protein [Bacillus salipaludis]|uniref:winged helix-turn-helix domain-containing protein n=1 Tax=Bacillus salipaludis TaxID=2547811 RepID=UPI003D20F0F2